MWRRVSDFQQVGLCLSGFASDIGFLLQPKIQAESLHSRERSERAVEGYRGVRIDGSNDIEKVFLRYASYMPIRKFLGHYDLLFSPARKCNKPYVPGQMLTSSETQFAWWKVLAKETLSFLLF